MGAVTGPGVVRFSAPEGRRTVAQGESPGNGGDNGPSPGGAAEPGSGAALRRPSGAPLLVRPVPRAFALGYRPPPLRGSSHQNQLLHSFLVRRGAADEGRADGYRFRFR